MLSSNIVMKTASKYLILSLTLSLFCFSANSAQKNTFSSVESGFVNLPDSLQTSIYWYWMSDNISKEGVIKDLKAMKSVGINRAFIGNIGGQGVPYGKVKIFSTEWWDILHTALKTATELNIEIGIFNSPGWSQSGGPWVKSEQSMRYLNSSEVEVVGPKKFSAKIPVPNKDFQTVSVIAYKLPAKVEKAYNTFNPKVVSEPKIASVNNIIDGDFNTSLALEAKKSLTIDFTTKNPFTARSLFIKTAEKPIIAQAELYVQEGTTYRLIKQFEIDRSRFNINVGFEPNAPIVISIPKTVSTNFRIVFNKVTVAGEIAEINFLSNPMIERFPEKSLAKMFQTPLPYWNEYMWDVQPEVDKSLSIDSKTAVDITKFRAADGTITWKVPAGRWKIMQTGMTSTGQTNGPASPEGEGLETDKMSKKHIAAHFDAFLGEIQRRIPAEDRKTWKVVVQDSYETGGQNWTDGMTEDFLARYGYSPLPFLPVLKGHVVDSRDRSDRFLWDLRRLVADKISYDYVGGLREVSHKHGLTTWLENYGHWGFPGEFLQYGGQSDEIGGEFWSEGSLGDIENRAASSCAHIYGKTKVSAESFTCGGQAYSRYPATMKQRGDKFFTEGINNTLLHLFIQQPDERQPGINAPFGNEFNRHNTWFKDMDLFVKYLKRTNFMLQQGKYVADAAYFIGEDAPKMTGVCDPALPKGYSFDYMNAEVIMTRMRVKDGKMVLPDGMTYSVLVLPKLETMRPEVLQKIKELVTQGAVVLGPAPKYSPSNQNFPHADLQVQKIATELWGNVDGVNVKSAKVGKGMILSGMEMQEVFDLLKIVPDCKIANDDASLFIHRRVADGEIYFISNQTNKTITIQPEFRVTSKSPELWSSVTASMRNLPAYEIKEKTTIVPLKLEAFESQFIVFRKDADKGNNLTLAHNFPDGKVIADLNENWTVTFDKEKRGVKQPVQFKELTDWTLSTNDSIKYYSGTAIYTKILKIPQALSTSAKYMLNLGNLTCMAKVKINNQYVGGVWTAPYKLDVSSALKMGENSIEISVVNNWMNRIIGDLKLPENERPTFNIIMPYNINSALQPSGLFGPVSLQELQY